MQGPTRLNDTTWQWADNFTWTRGKHEFKFGADFTRLELNFDYDYYNNGGFDFGSYNSAFTGSYLADFVGGFWDNYYQNSKQPTEFAPAPSVCMPRIPGKLTLVSL